LGRSKRLERGRDIVGRLGLGEGPVEGRLLSVPGSRWFHQSRTRSAATTATIAVAANISALVRRSGILTSGRQRRRLSGAGRRARTTCGGGYEGRRVPVCRRRSGSRPGRPTVVRDVGNRAWTVATGTPRVRRRCRFRALLRGSSPLLATGRGAATEDRGALDRRFLRRNDGSLDGGRNVLWT